MDHSHPATDTVTGRLKRNILQSSLSLQQRNKSARKFRLSILGLFAGNPRKHFL